jgi:kinesin family member 5
VALGDLTDIGGYTEKTINDEETSHIDIGESITDLRVRSNSVVSFYIPLTIISQNKLEAQYAAKRDAYQSEVLDLKQQLEMRGNEVRTLNATIDSLKGVNEELKVCF